MMMNGELMQTAVSCKPGSFLATSSSKPSRQGGRRSLYGQSIYLAALSRHPSAKELEPAAALS